MASCLVLPSPWGAQATRSGPPHKGGNSGRNNGGNDDQKDGGNGGRNHGRKHGPKRPDRPPSAAPNGTIGGNITMAPASVLAASMLAATLSNLAYPTSVLSVDDALASYTDPAAFQT